MPHSLVLTLQLIFGALFYTVIGLGVLACLLGERRHTNNIYRLMATLVAPFLGLAGRLLPGADRGRWLRALVIPLALACLYAFQFKIAYAFLSLGLPLTLREYAYVLATFIAIGLLVPAPVLHPFLRGVLAMVLIETLHLALLYSARTQGWVAGT
ncbi:MAG TPA: hypothetical protein VNN09_11270 [Candidatus Competibacteraceae bacterium]|nr:hypothetical protein [Candidatus Competibacteraceae bacterium]